MEPIAAVSSGAGASGIGIVRLSGDGCFSLCDRVFAAKNGRSFADQPSHRLVFGAMLDAEGRVIDRGLAARFPAGRSYTGEESAEFHCHGSPIVLQELLRALFAAGARQARPGEYTQRAFFNGRLDLTEAEAVIDLIDAETAEAARNAAGQIDGALRDLAEQASASLTEIASRFYAVVDYPDEDIEDLTAQQLTAGLCDTERTLSALLATFARGRVVKSGAACAIIGAPNAGKSSLLNRLAGYDRAIVTDIPGTTRDTVEEKVLLGGVLLRLIDTAGLRETAEPVEAMGVERARRAAETADLILALADGSRPLSSEDEETLHLAAQSGIPWIFVRTKADLPSAPAPGAVPAAAQVSLSSRTGEGLDDLAAAVAAVFPAPPPSATLLTNPRQAAAVERALASVRSAREAMDSGMTPDAVLTDAEAALDALGELTGRTAKEEIVDAIFSRFCVGK